MGTGTIRTEQYCAEEDVEKLRIIRGVQDEGFTTTATLGFGNVGRRC